MSLRMSPRLRAPAAALVALTVLAGVGVRGAYTFGVVHHQLKLPWLQKRLRVVQLSDLHFGRFIRAASVDAWVKAVLAQQPDLIVITGDFVDSRVGDGRPALLRALKQLSAPLGVWGVWGNHDHLRLRERLGDFERQLRKVGVQLLVNTGIQLRPDFFLAGVDDYLQGTPDVPAALRKRSPGSATVLLSHHPDVLPTVPQDVTLSLSGHTHGGQLKFPGLRWLYRWTPIGALCLEGFVHAPALGYVSRGLGVTWVPMRIGSPAELSVFDLQPLEGRPTCPQEERRGVVSSEASSSPVITEMVPPDSSTASRTFSID
ncbi:metallophosphoesterase [Deinococcus peraridilitoris]|uniref:Putative phosphohydrolase n=1 Tax=Deinococcus peraridilitoris (strain DSM 19664 / LMG 22246 / CIP 109416 / KR-200) TaxID=937777 RepID=L0A3E5_DEIPD|nr:metallophosphoesterase [Deinococcus peraridilitoris]AFZ67692.1 putative phosphohydrolase [Deinococcus peraridilitoris DSM 19664]